MPRLSDISPAVSSRAGRDMQRRARADFAGGFCVAMAGAGKFPGNAIGGADWAVSGQN